MEYYTAGTKKELLPFMVAWVEVETIMVRKISKSVKYKDLMNSLISVT